ncbi:MAG TPA: efflux RND transporter periplasmic adaptor subunit, partial [Chthoniobacterales bacterium]
MKTTIRRVPLQILALSLLAFSLGGCGKGKSPMQAPPPPAVTVAPVIQENLIEWSEFTGRTDAVESVEVRPRVSGHIEEVRFQSGQLVKKGDVLFVIDPRPYQAESDQRTAEFEQAKARYENAGRIAQRAAKLLERKTIADEAADTSLSEFQEAKAALLAAQAAMESARLDLGFTQVRAPIDGRVSRAL